MNRDPNLLTTSANRHLFQPTKDHKQRRKSNLKDKIHKGKTRSTSRSKDDDDEDAMESKLHRDLSPSSSKNNKIDESQLVDLIVEDEAAEQMERVRARKEGGDAWNNQEQKHFVRTYSIGSQHSGDSIREGFEPDKIPPDLPIPEHAVSDSEQEEESGSSSGPKSDAGKNGYESIEDRNVWND